MGERNTNRGEKSKGAKWVTSDLDYTLATRAKTSLKTAQQR